MAPRPESGFVTHLRELLAPLGAIGARRMFGGYGVTCDGVFFALVADDVLYLKVDDATRPAYEARGLGPFKPFADKPGTMSYHPPPEEALEDSESLLAWARPALEVALRARAAESRRPRRRRTAP